MRKRKGLKGNKNLTYLFRKYKNSDIPSRRESFSAQGGKVSKRFEERGTEFKLFPIGNNYKICYHPSVEDFNYNELHFYYTKRLSILGRVKHEFGFATSERDVNEFIDNPHGKKWEPTKKFKEMNRKEEKEIINKFLRKYFEAVKQSVDSSYNFDKMDDFFNFIENKKQNFKKYLPETIKVYENHLKYIKTYLSEYLCVQRLHNDMYNKELSVYAPNGVYYVGKNINIV